jgi:tetraacyldisaccharide 4'-kinase
MRAPDFWQKGGALPALLSPLGALYGASVALKAVTARPFDPGLPVICVGNLTAGGSGKTPVALAIADMLRARGHRPYFLTRGYGGSERGPALASRGHAASVMGDEALLLARTAPAIVARDRAAGARLAKEKRPPEFFPAQDLVAGGGGRADRIRQRPPDSGRPPA